MIEIFTEISVERKKELMETLDKILKEENLTQAAIHIAEMANHSIDIEANFIDFYFNLRMEQLKNESFTN